MTDPGESDPTAPRRTTAHGSSPADARRFRANLLGEVDGAALYEALARAEKRPELADVFRRLAETEREHGAYWEGQLRAIGAPVPALKASWRPRMMGWLARRFGTSMVLPTVNALEQKDTQKYASQTEAAAAGMPADEQSHARLLQAIISGGKGVEGGVLGRLEGRHRAVGGNALRAAVLGANDGLVSNLSLVMGVAGAHLADQSLLITGIAGLLAGAGSMAMGEWLSVQSARELAERQISVEREELAHAPEEEEQELALIYQAKGLPEADAKALAARLLAEPATALDTLAREELGIDPEELGGSAWEAAITSFILFAIGAIIPVAPFIGMTGEAAIVTSVLLSAAALFLIGAGITLLTGRNVWFSGFRQLLIGIGAAGLTFGVGRLIGVAVTG